MIARQSADCALARGAAHGYCKASVIDLDQLAHKRKIAHPDENRALGDIRREILEEMAASLGRAEARIRQSLARLVKLAAELDSAADGSTADGRAIPADRTRQDILQEYQAERATLQHRRWELMVQREAMGLRRHGILDRMYPVPPPRH